MSCLNGVLAQIATFLSVPHEILLLRHKVFHEYAKVAVGPDFIHTLPSFLILAAMTLVFWKHPPNSKWFFQTTNGFPWIYKTFQIVTIWTTIDMIFWTWLIFQRILYCMVWIYWNNETEYRDAIYPWWQRVWSLYYPPPMQPPVISAGLISWIISMFLSTLALGCAISMSRAKAFLDDFSTFLQDLFITTKNYIEHLTKKILDVALSSDCDKSSCDGADGSDSSLCEDFRSEISGEIKQAKRQQVYPICYGTNWAPKPSFLNFEKEAQRKASMKSVHTVTGVIETQRAEQFSSRCHKRGCQTAIPSNSSEISSGC
ncbi:hypothetical protein M0802_000263 [Mischocyttarus mexicanus]|nr:hypothetical protein M0802_000263 [Mischocyttarus mexicanus]